MRRICRTGRRPRTLRDGEHERLVNNALPLQHEIPICAVAASEEGKDGDGLEVKVRACRSWRLGGKIEGTKTRASEDTGG